MSLIEESVNTNDQAFLYLDLRPDEKINFIVRHHWAGFLGTLGLFIAMSIFPLLIVFTAHLVLGNNIGQYLNIITTGLTGYYLFLVTFLFGAWINYYYDIIFITNERILNVNQKGLLARDVSELSLQQVQDVSTQMDGILRSYFNFGTLIVETAGEGTADQITHGLHGYFSVDDLPDPNRLARVISDLHRQITHEDD